MRCSKQDLTAKRLQNVKELLGFYDPARTQFCELIMNLGVFFLILAAPAIVCALMAWPLSSKRGEVADSLHVTRVRTPLRSRAIRLPPSVRSIGLRLTLRRKKGKGQLADRGNDHQPNAIRGIAFRLNYQAIYVKHKYD